MENQACRGRLEGAECSSPSQNAPRDFNTTSPGPCFSLPDTEGRFRETLDSTLSCVDLIQSSYEPSTSESQPMTNPFANLRGLLKDLDSIFQSVCRRNRALSVRDQENRAEILEALDAPLPPVEGRREAPEGRE
ncbi:unnamed protein product [Cyprideis torosa]|uniref:Uncharacterized protein n=1 Tax=Cyprideis torosa TaxID=163714 RepID=A0A7R8W9E8_9CRUS|nr:unnamed protein product [Cyprideis torosa]CAG0884780.1 unnamed protein product [Cyprideis torosa]